MRRRYVAHESRRQRPITMWRWPLFIAGASLLVSVVLTILHSVIIASPNLGFMLWVVVSGAGFVAARAGLDRARSRI